MLSRVLIPRALVITPNPLMDFFQSSPRKYGKRASFDRNPEAVK
jgi:hypothetical protein